MVAYDDASVIPVSRDQLWQLLARHLDDPTITAIHPLVTRQTTVSRTATETLVDRVINVRGKSLTSRWRIVYEPPNHARWEILASQGPWASGSYVDVTYSDAPNGTLVSSRGDLRISVLPFFMSQIKQIRKAFDMVHDEDLAFLHR